LANEAPEVDRLGLLIWVHVCERRVVGVQFVCTHGELCLYPLVALGGWWCRCLNVKQPKVKGISGYEFLSEYLMEYARVEISEVDRFGLVVVANDEVAYLEWSLKFGRRACGVSVNGVGAKDNIG
jgi:hypothetical protein